MRITNTTYDQLQEALATVNEMFDNNITFKNCTAANTKETIWNVSLRAVDSRKAGARRSPGRLGRNDRRSIAACWHVHGYFHDALPKNATITTGYYNHRTKKHPGDPWVEQNMQIGWGTIRPMSDLCDCE